MRLMGTGAALIALCLGAAFCAEQPVSPVGATAQPVTSSLISGPAIPGASGVYRSVFGATLRLDYETSQGTLLVRHYPSDDSFEVCGGSQTLPPIVEQLVTDPDFINGVIVALQQTGDVPVLIYLPYDGGKDFCTYLAEDWIYKGTGRLLYHDNNVFFDPSRTNAFGWSGQGMLVDQGGQSYQYNETQFLSVDPGVAIRTIISSLKITPTK